MNKKARKANPYDWITPIKDPKLFAGRRDELSKVMVEILRLKEKTPITPILAITGERRVGKTSFLLRIKEKCEDSKLKSIIFSIEETKAVSSWEFWAEIFNGLFMAAMKEGIAITGSKESMGFIVDESDSKVTKQYALNGLIFPEEYKLYLAGSRAQPSTFIIENDFEIIIGTFRQLGYAGLVLILDEAHVLLKSPGVKQQLRNIVHRVPNCGIVLAGETSLAHMFTDASEPFYGQANVIPLGNFIDLDDVVECALLPLEDNEIKLMSPMTINYIASLSRGKPNQIRLICSSIYRRYANDQQEDLSITIDVLDDILEGVAQTFEDPDLKEKVARIQKLDSADLELLHSMTRYPNWMMQDIVDLDESFRGDCRSHRANSRRKRCLKEKHRQFVELGLMSGDEERCQVMGGEFVSLYLRFFYETRKYGQLSRNLILGKGPPTLFGETTEKLVRSLAYHFGQSPELQSLVFHHFHRDFGDIIDKVKRRFAVLEQLRNGQKPQGKDLDELIPQCFTTCELIGKEGSYFLLCLSVRNRDNPREIIQVELYFDLQQDYAIDLESAFKVVNQQAEDARVLIEGYSGFWVKLPNLMGLLKGAGIIFEDLLKRVPLKVKWHLSSIQHLVKTTKEVKDSKDDTDKEVMDWVELYGKGEEEKAEKSLILKLSETEERCKRARLYNDLGYIRCGDKLKNCSVGRKDLETAFDLHYYGLTVTLLNLSYLDIDEENYDKAIEKIESVLLLSISPAQTKAAYLRLRLPENHLGFRVKCEQHPVNVIEAAYINLTYAMLKSKGYDQALDVLEEGLELFPSSIPIKHTRARLYIHKKRVDLALPIYREISQSRLTEKYIEFEVKYFKRHIGGSRRKKR
jgi:tetratricopeptide (TPR) repeat protein